jgi:transcriptional antiterminator RfaH
MAFWTAARIMPRRERLALHCLKISGFETYLPRTKERSVVRGRKVNEIAPLFPSYVFVLIELQWHAARYALGVVNLIMDGERPARVPDAVISDLRGREHGGLIKLPPPPKVPAPFAEGEQLRIRSGPFTGLYGLSLCRHGAT